MTSPVKNNFRRYNPLLDEWVIVAANRVNRPWQGAKTATAGSFQKNDVINQLAPGGIRSNGMITPEYTSTFVFENDFPSFTDLEGAEPAGCESTDLFRQEEIRGVCRVVCYHPDTDKTIAIMTEGEVLQVVRLWMEQFNELKNRYRWVQIFENRGAAVGCSNAHPHGQIWAGNFLPSLAARKDKCQKNYFERTGKVLLLDYLQQELSRKERVVLSNDFWVVLVPFWAVWPYETILVPRRHVMRMDQLTEEERVALAAILRQLVAKYDNIFQCTFPYSMGWLGAPTGPELANGDLVVRHWQLHAAFHPPLLRSATVPKFMAGYEVFAEPQRDITPEAAAATIREQSDKHYSCHE